MQVDIFTTVGVNVFTKPANALAFRLVIVAGGGGGGSGCRNGNAWVVADRRREGRGVLTDWPPALWI